MNFSHRALASLVLVLAAGCGSSSGEDRRDVALGLETPLPARRGTIVVDGCALDTWSRSVVARPATKRVASELVFLCLVPRESGEVGPRDPSARGQLAAMVADLRQEGWKVELGLSFTDETGQRYDGAQTRAWLARADFVAKLRDDVRDVAQLADGIDVDLQKLPSDARGDVTSMVSLLSEALRPSRRLGLFVPPSVTSPSDLPGGDAFDLGMLAPFVDRVRVATLDYSDTAAGPTIDPGWAVDAVRLAHARAANVDVSVPLYGTDFGPRGTRTATWFEAVAIAASSGVPISRGPTNAPFVRYTQNGELHELWFDDAASTGTTLGAWTYDVLPPDVGVVYYGLGAEEPGLFERLSARLP